MVKRKKKWYHRINRRLLVVAAVALAIGAVWGISTLVHNHAVAADKARFTQAGKDIQTIAGQIVAAAGQPQDRKDGGDCTYAHQEFDKGPLSCDVYSYLAFGVNGPGDVNSIVQKTGLITGLQNDPWKFKAVTEKPHQFTNGVNYSENFVNLKGLFDTEVKSVVYTDRNSTLSCGISYLYYNTLSNLSSYPSFNLTSNQALLLDVGCGGHAKSQYFTLTE